MKKLIHIVGARPQFIKLAPLIHQLTNTFHNVIIHTGQHYDNSMSNAFFEDLDIPEPNYNLGVGSGSHGEQTAKMLKEIEFVLQQEKPDAVIVYGDTNSTLAGVLAAVKLNIFTAHVEACLRSFDRSFPEEINRICTDHISSLLFVPTQVAMQNAIHEGLAQRAHLVGDIMTDSLAYGLSKVKNTKQVLIDNNIEPDTFNLLTLHRPFNVDNMEFLSELMFKLNKLGVKFVFPVHPRTARVLEKLEFSNLTNFKLIPPQSYLNFISLMSNSRMIFTDSGGIQKEAYILNKMCVTLRCETEWVETVESGWNILVNPNSAEFDKNILELSSPDKHEDIFGKNVSQKIQSILTDTL